MIKKTYIPGKPRNPKLTATTGASGVSKTEFKGVVGSSHEHYNKGVLDQITEAMLIGAVREMITSTDTTSELTDENILSALRVLSEISKANADLLNEIKTKFLSKIEPDIAQKLIKFVEGLEVGPFSPGLLGSGAAIKMLDGVSYAEVDHLLVRQKATFVELVIESLKHVGGQLILSPARMKCVAVADGGSYYRCYFDNDGGAISNEFVAGDQARCEVFTGSGTKFYWRLVTSVGDDWINLSKTDAVSGSDIPEAGDEIVQLGNRNDITRQSAHILSTIGDDAPSWKQYAGINSFSLGEEKILTKFTRLGNRIHGKTVFRSDGTNYDDWSDSVASDIQDTQAAVNNLEIGGRNLFAASRTNRTAITNSKEFTEIFYGSTIFNNATVFEMFSPSTQYTIQYEVEIISKPTGVSLTQAHGGFRFYNPITDAATILAGISHSQYENSSVGDVFKLKRTFTTPADLTNYTLVGYTAWIPSVSKSATMTFRNLKIEKGNKATDWSPAPEDVQAEIDAVQSNVNTVSNSVTNLNTYIDGAFKDGVISEAEAKAIEKYKNSINESMSKAEASFAKVFANTYLEGAAKTALENAKINLWGQRDTLLTTINNAIADGKTTVAEKSAVDSAFNTFNNLMSAFQSALEEANKAIQAKLDSLSTEKVNNLEIGGRNLFEWNKISYSGTYWELSNEPYELKSKSALSSLSTFYVSPFMEVGEQYTISFEIKASVSGIAWENSSLYLNSANVTTHNIPTLTPDKYVRVQKTFTWKDGGTGRMHIYISGLNTTTNYVLLRNIQIEKGAKATGWTPAPEDVDKKISEVDAKAVEALTKANISKAITDKFGTDITGGLITTVMMLLREVNSQINTAGFSGLQKDANGIANQPSYWSGGTHEQAQAFVPFVKKLENEQSTSLAEYNNLPSIVFLHNGAAKIGHFIVLTSGEILIVDPSTGSVKLKFTTAELPSIADLVTGTNSQGSTAVGGGVASISSSQVVSGSTVVSKNGTIATFNGTHISISARGIAQAGGMASYAEAVLYARQNGVRVQRLASVTVHFTDTVYENKSAEVLPVPFSFPVDAGTYTFELVIHTTGTISSGDAITSSSNFSWKHTVAGVKKQQYSKDGMMFFYSNRHFYYNELTGLDVKESAYNKFEMPGVLAAGSVDAAGVQTNVWGAKSSPAGAGAISGGRSVPLANMKHSNYVVQITPHTATTFRVGTKTTSSFQAIGTGGFDYVVIGNNY